MLSETREAPALVEAALTADTDLYAAIGAALRERQPSFVATVARGSSDHAASYAASLFGILAGKVTATVSPSLVTRYGAKLDLDRAVVLALSQSGTSPDLVQVMAAAREAGALTAAVVNVPGSQLAAKAEWVLPQRAGQENAVAATKSFILTLLAVARLTAAWTQDTALTGALPLLPDTLEAALACDWSAGLPALCGAPGIGTYVVGRGPGLAIAQEAALKLKETSNLHAEAVSAAEIQHGPRAVVNRDFPLLAFGLDDAGGADTKALAAELRSAGARVLLASPGPASPNPASPNPAGSEVHLPLPPPLHPLLDPIAAVLAFYPFAEALAHARGLNPDRPRGLHKVTRTI